MDILDGLIIDCTVVVAVDDDYVSSSEILTTTIDWMKIWANCHHC